MESAFNIQQRLWRRYVRKRDQYIEQYGNNNPKTTRMISLAWIKYRKSLRENRIVATDKGWVFRE